MSSCHPCHAMHHMMARVCQCMAVWWCNTCNTTRKTHPSCYAKGKNIKQQQHAALAALQPPCHLPYMHACHMPPSCYMPHASYSHTTTLRLHLSACRCANCALLCHCNEKQQITNATTTTASLLNSNRIACCLLKQQQNRKKATHCLWRGGRSCRRNGRARKAVKGEKWQVWVLCCTNWPIAGECSVVCGCGLSATPLEKPASRASRQRAASQLASHGVWRWIISHSYLLFAVVVVISILQLQLCLRATVAGEYFFPFPYLPFACLLGGWWLWGRTVGMHAGRQQQKRNNKIINAEKQKN